MSNEIGADRLQNGTDQRQHLHELLRRGLALAAQSDSTTTSALAPIYALADELDEPGVFAKAACAAPIGYGHMGVPLIEDRAAIARLNQALERIVDPGPRALVLATLALQNRSLGRSGHDALLIEARALADKCQDRAVDDLVFFASASSRRSLSHSNSVDRDLGERLINPPLERHAAQSLFDLGVTLAFGAGELGRAAELLVRIEQDWPDLSTLQQWRLLRAKAALSFARGSVEAARQLAIDAVRVARNTRLDADSLDHFGFQLTAILRERHKLADARPTAETWVDTHPSSLTLRAARAWLRCEVGDAPAARSDLEIFFATMPAGLAAMPDGLAAIASAVVAAAAVGGEAAADWCREGYRLLEPYEQRWIVVGDVSLIDGPVSRSMALASSALGQPDRALSQIEVARTAAVNAGASLFVWHAIRDRGHVLARANRYVEAKDALTEASERYRSGGLVRQADHLDANIAAMGLPGASMRSRRDSVIGQFHRRKNVWHLQVDDQAFVVRHLKGMPMLQALLAAPGQELSAMTLAAIAEGDAGEWSLVVGQAKTPQPVIDDEAVKAYRRRLEQIAGELDRADRTGDVEASLQLSTESDAIMSELAATHGLGGRRRAMTDEAERARVRVTKSIRASIRRISDQAPALGAHLERSIQTGRFCIYQPLPGEVIDWGS